MGSPVRRFAHNKDPRVDGSSLHEEQLRVSKMLCMNLRAQFDPRIDSWLLTIGDTRLDEPEDDRQIVTAPIQETIRHPKWDFDSRKAYYDVAIWVIGKDFVKGFSDYIRPVCLPTKPDTNPDSRAGQRVVALGKDLDRC